MDSSCPKCKSSHINKKGFRKNESSKKQKYQCFDCKHWFVEPDGFERMRHNAKVIVRAIHMHNDGMSLFKVKTHLWQYDKVKVTRATISRWTKKYSLFLKSDTPRSKAKA